jgi:hypothetical protein
MKYLLYISPALLLALWAQFRVKSAYAIAQQMPAPLSGAAAARHILDSAGLQDVTIEPIPGELSDHYDSREKVLRLSEGVYERRSLAAVGIAAHEAGHALQDAKNYAPLTIRNAAVPIATFGSGPGVWMIVLGAMLHTPVLIQVGIALFAAVVFSARESAGRIRRQQPRQGTARAIGHYRPAGIGLRASRTERRRVDLCSRHAAIGDDSALLSLAVRRFVRPRLRRPGLKQIAGRETPVFAYRP